jgi:hypothetical protein
MLAVKRQKEVAQQEFSSTNDLSYKSIMGLGNQQITTYFQEEMDAFIAYGLGKHRINFIAN